MSLKANMKTLKRVFSAILDLLLLQFPPFQRLEGFAFVVHPRDMGDVYRYYPFLKLFPKNIVFKFLLWFWPITVSRITGVINHRTGKEIPGWMISSPIIPELLVHDRDNAEKSFLRTVALAERKGAKFIGLGALSASLTKGGKTLADKTKSIIITGRLFTAKNVCDLAHRGAVEVGISPQSAQVSIVGAAGSIGSASAQILAHLGYFNFNLIDLSGKRQRLEEIISIMKQSNPSVTATVCEDLGSLPQSDLIIVATNRVDAFVKSEHLKPGTVVVDDAKPVNVDSQVIKTRPDVLVLEGGAVQTDNIDVHINIGLQNKTDIYSCLAEVVVLAASEIDTHYNIGELLKIDFTELERLDALAARTGVKKGNFQNYIKTYTREDIATVRAARTNRM